jgi:hypothetical protein
MITINFGKYARATFNTVEEILWRDPGYVWWMESERMHHTRRDIDTRAFDALTAKARNLKIPRPCVWCKGERPVTRMFVTRHISRGAACVDFDCDECKPMGGSMHVALPPGFFTPDIFRSYDKTGGRFLVEAIKREFFGDKSYRMTKKRVEEFWNDASNFNP